MAVNVMVQLDGNASTLGSSKIGLENALAKIKSKLAKTFSTVLLNAEKSNVQLEAMLEALLGSADGADDLTNSINKTATTTRRAAKRILADFDEIRRLGEKTGSTVSSTGTTSAKVAEAEKLAAILQQVTKELKDAMVALRTVSAESVASFITVIQNGFRQLQSVEKVVDGLLTSICAGFTSSWNSIWAILAKTEVWLKELVIRPVLTECEGLFTRLRASIDSLRVSVTELFSGIAVLARKSWELTATSWGGANAWFFANVTQPIAALFAKLWTLVCELTGSGLERVKGMLGSLSVWVGTDVIRLMAQMFGQLWVNIQGGAVQTADALRTAFMAALQVLGKTFREVWARLVQSFAVNGTVYTDVREGTQTIFKALINELIRGMNGAFEASFGALNEALLTLKRVEFGGEKPFSGLRTVPVPQVPYLARGAVLPANRPFLAMVGDQKHGTNVEAPLSTIQEALELAMEDMGRGNDDAVLEVLQQILQAVLGIRVGDEVIGQAAARYNRKMAVVRGGSL